MASWSRDTTTYSQLARSAGLVSSRPPPWPLISSSEVSSCSCALVFEQYTHCIHLTVDRRTQTHNPGRHDLQHSCCNDACAFTTGVGDQVCNAARAKLAIRMASVLVLHVLVGTLVRELWLLGAAHHTCKISIVNKNVQVRIEVSMSGMSCTISNSYCGHSGCRHNEYTTYSQLARPCQWSLFSPSSTWPLIRQQCRGEFAELCHGALQTDGD